MQLSFEQAIAQRRSAPAQYPQGRFDGRGIVLCAGGERYFTCAWVLISILRRVHHCALPIQVWHLGNREMSEEMVALLVEEKVEVVNAEAVVARYPARVAGGWPLKPYAIAQSRFREVLYLDADTVPLVDPQTVWRWKEYQENGLMLWPDQIDIKVSNPIWAKLGLTPSERMSVDSGIIVADKARVWDILDLAVLMNEYCEDVYDLLHGDKDTFLIAALLLNRGFALVPHRPFQLEWDMVQRDPTGEPFLHHRTGSKWLLNRPNRAMADPSLMPACKEALAELRRRWSGVVFHAPERSQRARAEEHRLIAVRNFRYQVAPDDVRNLELLPGGLIGQGAAFLERNWAVIEDAGGLVLRFYVGQSPFVTLEKLADGSWRGTNGAPGSEILLQERSAGASSHNDSVNLSRSTEDLVGALLCPTLFALGYDIGRASALETTLSFLNELYDDVPEQVIQLSLDRGVPRDWQGHLDRVAVRLTAARKRRMIHLRPAKMQRAVVLTLYARPPDT